MPFAMICHIIHPINLSTLIHILLTKHLRVPAIVKVETSDFRHLSYKDKTNYRLQQTSEFARVQLNIPVLLSPTTFALLYIGNQLFLITHHQDVLINTGINHDNKLIAIQCASSHLQNVPSNRAI